MDMLIAVGALVVAIVGAFFAGQRKQRVDGELEEKKRQMDAEKRIRDAVESVNNDDDGAWRDRLRGRSK
tara:strand:- start:4997 stop:5203 length:207 start_codon:yes stop_codon:yes gene_type:complete